MPDQPSQQPDSAARVTFGRNPAAELSVVDAAQLAGHDLGSLNLLALNRLQAALLEILGNSTCRQLVVDFSGVEILGAGLLSVLCRIRRHALESGSELCFSGDHRGVLAAMQVSSLIPGVDEKPGSSTA